MYEELGLFEVHEQSTNYVVKNYSETFLSSGRLDSEYYQAKYNALFKRLSELESRMLSSLVEIKKSIEPGSAAYRESGIPFVRVQDLSVQGLSEPRIYLDKKEYSSTLKPQADTILFSKDGSVGIAYKVQAEDGEMITSSAILHLKVKTKDVLPDYLTLILNSHAVRLQAERDAGGSIINHWKPSEISKVLIPVIPFEQQQDISALVQKSFRLKKKSKHCLDVAIRAVETAIEEGESTAIKYLERQQLTS